MGLLNIVCFKFKELMNVVRVRRQRPCPCEQHRTFSPSL